jgi:hypothetical protein
MTKNWCLTVNILETKHLNILNINKAKTCVSHIHGMVVRRKYNEMQSTYWNTMLIN